MRNAGISDAVQRQLVSGPVEMIVIISKNMSGKLREDE